MSAAATRAPRSRRRLPSTHRLRQGFSLIEMMIVVALIGILTSAGYVIARDLVPQYRTRGAAMDFANTVGQCRSMAMTTGRDCRILLVEYDDDLANPDDNYGKYLIQVEITQASSTGSGSSTTLGWDTLPIDTVGDTTDDNESTGTIDLSTAPTRQRRVAIADWGSIGGPGLDNDNAIVFDTRGFVSNPSSDFTDGKITVTFVNKVAEFRGSPDQWEVEITRAGLAKLNSSRRVTDDNVGSGGTAVSTTADSDGVFGSP